MRRRVVVTGVGCINPMGNDVETMWKGLKEGRSGVGRITIFDASSMPTRIAAEIKNWDITQTGESAETWRKRGRHSCFAAGAARQAIDSSGVLDHLSDPTRFGVYLGAGEGNQDFNSFTRMVVSGLKPDGFDLSQFLQTGLQILDAQSELEQEPNMPAGHLASLFNAQGPNLNCLTACAASSQAVGEATEIIRRGEADVMLSGGAHSMIHPMGVTGFNLLTALSTSKDDPSKASPPFDRLRDGIVLGGGAA
ncbi:MAG: beta-ketoacyl-[acyl-carrier-protein] synthase family protein, partial [Planctomycetota bacterium]